MNLTAETSETSRTPRVRTRVLAVAALIAVVAYAVTRPSHDVSFVPAGAPLSLPLAGELTDLTESQFEGVLVGLRGTPVIVNVWASWCSPCRTETPLLERTWKAHRQKVVILGVDSKDVASYGHDFMDEFKVSYPNIFDGSGDIRAKLGLRGFPTTYVFGADGKLRTIVVGGLTEQRLAAILEDLGA